MHQEEIELPARQKKGWVFRGGEGNELEKNRMEGKK